MPSAAAPKPRKDALPVVDVSESELEQLRPAAEAGDAAAMVKLGHYYMSHYEEGYVNEKKAGEWFRKAAEAEDAEGMAWYAVYLLMTSESHSPEKTPGFESWARKAAEKGNAIGQYMMGILHRLDVEEREHWHTLAARQGFAPSIRNLAQLTFREKNHKMNDKKDRVARKAVKSLARGAKLGDVDTLILLVRGSLSNNYRAGGNNNWECPVKQSEKYARAAIEAAKARPWSWYENAFEYDMFSKRYGLSTVRCYQVIRSYCALYDLYRFDKDKVKAEKAALELVDCLKQMAEEGDAVAANLALAHLLRDWNALYIKDMPCPENYKPYAQKAAKAAGNHYYDPILRRRAAGM